MSTSNVFKQFATLIADHSGIQLAHQREQMLRNCVAARMNALQLTTLEDYYKAIINDATENELHGLIDSVAVNFTSFFRDERQFAILQKELESLLKSGRKRIRIWSAACSTGEEAYSIAMCAQRAIEKTKQPNVNVRILGTDISTPALRHAQHGIYDREATKGLDKQLQSYLRPLDGQFDAWQQVVPQVRRLVVFRKMNLTQDTWKILGDVDIIFCRNVLIYFDQATQERVISKAIKLLAPGGILFLGACESMRHALTNVDTIAPSVFKRSTSESYITQPLPPSQGPSREQLVDS